MAVLCSCAAHHCCLHHPPYSRVAFHSMSVALQRFARVDLGHGFASLRVKRGRDESVAQQVLRRGGTIARCSSASVSHCKVPGRTSHSPHLMYASPAWRPVPQRRPKVRGACACHRALHLHRPLQMNNSAARSKYAHASANFKSPKKLLGSASVSTACGGVQCCCSDPAVPARNAHATHPLLELDSC